MSDTPTPNLSTQGTFDRRNLYKNVRFQQGKPVLDTELNDAQDMSLEEVFAKARLDTRFSGVETSPFEFAVLPADVAPASVLNEDNFAITLGRLPTRGGIIDTDSLHQIAEDQWTIPYDGFLYTQNGGNSPDAFGNYVFKGFVSDTDPTATTTKLVDLSKNYGAHHLLVESTTAFTITDGLQPKTLNVKTGGCRVMFTNAVNQANVNVPVEITGVSGTTLVFNALPADIKVGDEYIILPPNMLAQSRNSWDSADNYETVIGAEDNPLQVIFINSWQEDISSNEDSNIENPNIGTETSHRTQLRWTARIAHIYGDAITTLATDLSDLGEHSFASSARDLIKTLITTQEFTLGSDQDSSWNIGVNGFTQQTLLLSSGDSVYDSSEDLALRDRPRSVMGTQKVSSPVVRKMGDDGLINFDILKALVGLHSTQGSDVAYDRFLSDQTILSLFSAPSKRLHQEYLYGGARLSTLQDYANNAAPAGKDVLSPVFWMFNYDPNHLGNLNVADGAQATIPRFWKNPLTSANANGFFTQVAGSDLYSVQPSIFINPPRVYLKASDASTEILRARQAFYGATPHRMMDQLRGVYAPLVESKLSLSEGETLRQVLFNSLDGRLDSYDNMLLAIMGQAGITQLRSAGDAGSSQSSGVYRVLSCGNSLLKDTHAVGIASSGTTYRQAENASADWISATNYGDSRLTFGTIDFEDPLYAENGAWPVSGENLGDTRPQLSSPESSYKVRELTNGSYSVSYNDDALGWNRVKSADEQRKWHEGIAQAKAFRDSFNLRKLAIKTTAHAEGDLFTIDQPLWFKAFDSNADILTFIRDNIVVGPGDADILDEGFFTALSNISFGGITPLASSVSAIRTQLADVESNGPMGITSSAGTSYSPELGSTGQSPLTKALGHVATNTTLLPFLANISGSSSISRIDQGSSPYLDDIFNLSNYYTDMDASSAKMLEPLKGAWGRRKITLDDLITASQNAGSNPGKEGLYMPSTSLDSNRATALRLRYHIGDFYPGETDANGVPSNLLVDSLNLFIRIEPLSFAHWMTMPKHQHSILEGSMDLSEAIATLLDLSNGRGIPDHLYTLTSAFASRTDTSDYLFIDESEGNVIPRAALDLNSFALSKNEPEIIINGTYTLQEAHARYYNSEIALAFREINSELFSAPGNQDGPNGTDIIFAVILGNEIDITSVFPAGGDAFTIDNYFQEIGVEANNGQYNLLAKWISGDQWKPLFDRWASARNRPLSADVLADPSLTETALKDFYLAVASHLKDVLSSFMYNSSTISKALDGLIDSGALRSDKLYDVIADLKNPNNPATSGLATTTPIISRWLSNLSPTAIKRMYPALAMARGVNATSPGPLPVTSALSLSALQEIIQAQANADGDLRDSDGNVITLASLFNDLLLAHTVEVGSVDPVAVCIPSNAQPYVHWWHPNMDALQAPGGEDGFWLNNADGAPLNSNETAVRYQAYPEWSRESMVYTGIVPISDKLSARGRGILQDNLGGSGWLADSGFNESALGEDNGDGSLAIEGFNALTFLNGIGIDPQDSSLSFAEIVESFYRASFDTTSGALQPHTPGFTGSDGNDLDPASDSFNYIPYFSHSTGTVGFGGLNLPNSVGFADGLDYEQLNYKNLSAADFTAWANWFPYLPSVTHQHGDTSNHYQLLLQNPTASNTLKDRLVRTVFYQATRPVYLPASMSVVDNVNMNAFSGGVSSSPLGYDADSRTQDNASYNNAGYHPLISHPTLELRDNNDPRDAYYDLRGLPFDANTLRVLQAMDTANISGMVGEEITDNNFSEIIPDVLPHTEPFSGAALRSGLKTDTLAWINLFVKTYNRTYGHRSIHPYSYLDDPVERPAWHIDFANSKGIVSGKGPDKDVDTLMMGDMGTNVFVSRRSVFLDPLCLGVGATRQDGTLVHDSDNDRMRDGNITFRDIFDMCAYEREAKRILVGASSNGDLTRTPQGLLYTSAMWSKLGMQTKLMLNTSIRVLHNRPGGAIAQGGAALNYGGLSSPTKSLTEMFLAVDAESNQLKQLPRDTISAPQQKPYIHLESMIDTGDISNLGGSRLHPNFPWMKPLKRMVSTNLSGGSNAEGVSFKTTSGLQVEPQLQTPRVKNNWLQGDNSLVQAGYQDESSFQRSLIPTHMGDTFASDPFDTLWDQGTNVVEKHSPIANSAANSGVEYELLSCLSRVHSQAQALNLKVDMGNSGHELIDSVVTPNELTLPGDHEIVFVIYTGSHGQSFAEDVADGLNPTVAGCHVKATLEVNRPSERIDSPHVAEHAGERALHYGVETPESLLPFGSQTADAIKIVPQGLMTYSVAGGRPTLDQAVYDKDGNRVN